MPNKNDVTTTQKRVLLGAGVPSTEQILFLFQTLTGREATPEERAQIEQPPTARRMPQAAPGATNAEVGPIAGAAGQSPRRRPPAPKK